MKLTDHKKERQRRDAYASGNEKFSGVIYLSDENAEKCRVKALFSILFRRDDGTLQERLASPKRGSSLEVEQSSQADGGSGG